VLVAAHQPTFLPWLGLFDKLVRADVLVLLDDVQAPRSGAGSWINRVRVLVGGEARWVTVPILRAHGRLQLVREVRIDETQDWRERIVRTVRHAYSRAPRFGDLFPLVEELIRRDESTIAAYNELNLQRVMSALDLRAARLVRSSELETGDSRGTELLVALTRAVGGTTYLSGDGSQGYLEPEDFAGSGVELGYQEYQHPRYPQGTGDFVPGLSVVDALLHCGIEATAELIQRRGR
jgi:hypothetical protein